MKTIASALGCNERGPIWAAAKWQNPMAEAVAELVITRMRRECFKDVRDSFNVGPMSGGNAQAVDFAGINLDTITPTSFDKAPGRISLSTPTSLEKASGRISLSTPTSFDKAPGRISLSGPPSTPPQSPSRTSYQIASTLPQSPSRTSYQVASTPPQSPRTSTSNPVRHASQSYPMPLRRSQQQIEVARRLGSTVVRPADEDGMPSFTPLAPAVTVTEPTMTTPPEPIISPKGSLQKRLSDLDLAAESPLPQPIRSLNSNNHTDTLGNATIDDSTKDKHAAPNSTDHSVIGERRHGRMLGMVSASAPAAATGTRQVAPRYQSTHAKAKAHPAKNHQGRLQAAAKQIAKKKPDNNSPRKAVGFSDNIETKPIGNRAAEEPLLPSAP